MYCRKIPRRPIRGIRFTPSTIRTAKQKPAMP
ncbi:hypothetical protein [Klebsiella phage KpF5]|nr:hypothetical protein [Klebsiella phage KpF5]